MSSFLGVVHRHYALCVLYPQEFSYFNPFLSASVPFHSPPSFFSLSKMVPPCEQPQAVPKKLYFCCLLTFLPIFLFRFSFHPSPIVSLSSKTHPQNSPIPLTPFTEEACDYTNGTWVPEKVAPLYNDTSCGTIKNGRNCISHGRPDLGFIYWKWQPKQCRIPAFEPTDFLEIIRNKHLAFVGDSIARNQLESLLCLISSVSSPELVYARGEDDRFRKWRFPSHNASISSYWSPFLVKGIEKTEQVKFNKMFLESVDDSWASDLDQMDMVVLTYGQWFVLPAVYCYGESVLGCHLCKEVKEQRLNNTEIEIDDIYGKALKTSLEAIIERRMRKGIDVIVTTFPPAHYEGEWDKFGACSRTEPYKEGEKQFERGYEAEMRKAVVDEVEAAKGKAQKLGYVRVEALDVAKLALMRPDGHPGAYLAPNPFENGIKEKVPNDCVHWCLPGPIDTWNEILLHLLKRWQVQV